MQIDLPEKEKENKKLVKNISKNAKIWFEIF